MHGGVEKEDRTWGLDATQRGYSAIGDPDTMDVVRRDMQSGGRQRLDYGGMRDQDDIARTMSVEDVLEPGLCPYVHVGQRLTAGELHPVWLFIPGPVELGKPALDLPPIESLPRPQGDLRETLVHHELGICRFHDLAREVERAPQRAGVDSFYRLPGEHASDEPALNHSLVAEGRLQTTLVPSLHIPRRLRMAHHEQGRHGRIIREAAAASGRGNRSE